MPKRKLSNQDLISVLNALQEGTILLDMQGIILQANGAAITILGEDLVGNAYQEIFSSAILHQPSGEPVPLDLLPITRALHGEKVPFEPFLLARNKAETVLLRCAAEPLQKKDGSQTGVISIWQLDESHQAKKTSAGAHGEPSSHPVLDAYPEGLAIVAGDELRFLYANQAYRQITADPFLDPTGRTFHEVWGDLSDAIYYQHILRDILHNDSEPQNGRYLFTSPKGNTRYLRYFFQRILWEGQPAVMLALWDVTKITLESQEQRRQKEILDQLVQEAPVGIALVEGPEHHYVLANAAYMGIASERGNIIGRTVAEVWPDAHEFTAALNQVYANGVTVRATEKPVQLARSSRIDETILNFTLTPFFNESHQVGGILLLVQNVTVQTNQRRITEERLRRESLVLGNVFEAIISADHRMRINVWNRAAEELFELSAEEVLGHPINELLEETSQSQAVEKALPVLRSGQTYRGDATFTRKDGSPLMIEFTAVALRDEDGWTDGYIIAARDMTNRKLAEKALEEANARLKESERWLQTVLDNLPVGVWLSDAMGKIFYGNPTGQRIWMGAQYVDMPDYRVYKARWADTGEELKSEDWAVYRAITRSETSLNELLEIECFDGSRKIILNSAVPIWDQHGILLGAVAVNDDLTELTRAQQALRESNLALRASESRMRRLFEANIIGIFYTRLDGVVTDANEAFLEISGYQRDDLREGLVNWMQMTPAIYHDYDNAYLGEAKEHGACTPYEKEFIRKDGSLVPVMLGFAVLEESSGDLIAFMLDLSELKQAERQLQRYASELERSNRDLQDFAFIASHDLQEPLRKVVAFSERLRVKSLGKLDAESENYLSRMVNAAERMQKMIDGLLTYSRVSTKARPFQPVDLNEVVREVLSDLEMRIEQTLGTVEAEPLPTIDADASQMHHMLQNLVANALKFHRKDVTPTVQIRSQPARAGFVEIIIEDNGIGFDPAQAERIFQPFFRLEGRSQFEGSGMGLAICRKIVERHGGAIRADSIPGQGSRFTITLPENH